MPWMMFQAKLILYIDGEDQTDWLEEAYEILCATDL